MYYCCHYTSPIGRLTLASDGEALTGLWLEGQKFFAHNHAEPVEMYDLPVFRDATVWLDRYFAGNPVTPDDLPLKPSGTVFQQKVWDILKSIPYGQIAGFLDCPKASQAVGAAVGRNPVSIIIPCHRVVGSNGKLTGYAGGIHKKIWLLRHEGRQVENHIVR